MAENADSTCRAIVQYIGEKLDLQTQFIADMPWKQRESLFDSGQIHICWICGLPYVWKVEAGAPVIELCVAPVMRNARYQNRPVYFSDVIVRRDSRFETFEDLRGASWAYNEPRSHSGYNVVRDYLLQLGEKEGFFGRVVESGSHQKSLRMVIDRKINASAIDSTVLDAELRRNPAIESAIRIVETIGPSPMPPWVIHKSVPVNLRATIAQVLLEMHSDSEGRQILDQWGISHFTDVEHSSYQPIQEMARRAATVKL